MQKVALVSDIHGNSPALEVVLNDIQHLECSQVFMLGDIINGVDPHGCVELLRNWANSNNIKLTCIQGNAEAYLLTPNRNSLPKQDKEWNVDMIHLTQWWQDHLTQTDMEWVSTFPSTLRLDSTLLVHDSPLDRLAVSSMVDPNIKPEYREWFYHGRGLTPDTSDEEWQRVLDYMDQEKLTHIFCGHTHRPFIKRHKDKVVCNLGSAGAIIDGDPRPSWVLWNQSSNEKENIEIRRVQYDIHLIHDLIERTPDYYDFKDPLFKEAYKKWMATGIIWRKHYPNSELG